MSRSRRKWYFISTFLVRWGLAVLVAIAAGVGLGIGATVAIPADVPGVALGAVPVYRLEVGAATFVGLYLVAMAFALSLQNRGFTEIGGNGFRAQDLGSMPELVAGNEVSTELLSESVEDMKSIQERLEEGRI